MENYARHELDTKNDSKFITSILSAQIAKKFKLTVPRKIK